MAAKMYSWCKECSCYHDITDVGGFGNVKEFLQRSALGPNAVIVPVGVGRGWYERYLAALEEARRG